MKIRGTRVKRAQFSRALAILLIATTIPAQAASKPKQVKMTELPTLVESNFFAGNGAQWFKTLLTKNSLFVIGTSEPAGGPTQAEVIAIDPRTGSSLWDLPIPTETDSIATSATIDPTGNIWVLGLSSPAVPTNSPQPRPSGVPNPSGVTIEPTPATRADLSRITVWEVNPSGNLAATYQYDAGKVFNPQSISFAKGLFLIAGSDFHLTLDQTGKFSKFVQASYVPPKKSSIDSFKDGLYIWKSYLTKSSIPGVVGWKPQKSERVILKVGSRTGTIYSAYKVSDELLSLDFLSGLGLAVTSQTPNGYAISLLK